MELRNNLPQKIFILKITTGIYGSEVSPPYSMIVYVTAEDRYTAIQAASKFSDDRKIIKGAGNIDHQHTRLLPTYRIAARINSVMSGKREHKYYSYSVFR